MKVSSRNHSRIAELLDAGVPFSTHGALRAEVTALPSLGILPIQYQEALYVATEGWSVPVMVLFSYATPIAWRTQGGDVWVPDVRYSATTSKHQSHARGWAMRNRVAVSA